MHKQGFAVIGFTATGLEPTIGARLREISVVHLDASGSIERRWTSGLDPRCPAGAGQEGIAEHLDLFGDPVFAQVANGLVERLAGRTIVAHHAATAIDFLAAEFYAIGLELPEIGIPLSTQELVRHRHSNAPRSLVGCVTLFALTVTAPTGAAWDAEATALLFAATRGGNGSPSRRAQPAGRGVASSTPTGYHAGQGGNGFLGALVATMPQSDGPAEVVDYLTLVDRCLLGGYFADEDSNGLVLVAERLGISRFRCESLHREYFGDLVDRSVAQSRGTPLEGQVEDLRRVGYLLDLPLSVISQILDAGFSAFDVSHENFPAEPPQPEPVGAPAVRFTTGRGLPRHLARIARLLVR